MVSASSGNFLILILNSGGLRVRFYNVMSPLTEVLKNLSKVSLAVYSSISTSSSGTLLNIAIHSLSS